MIRDEGLRPTFLPTPTPPRGLALSPRSAWWADFMPDTANSIATFTHSAALYLDFFLTRPDFDPVYDPGTEPPPGGGEYPFSGRLQQLQAIHAEQGQDFLGDADAVDEADVDTHGAVLGSGMLRVASMPWGGGMVKPDAFFRWIHTLVGASLLANAVYQPTCVLADTPASRASSLPQGLCVQRRRTGVFGAWVCSAVGTSLPAPRPPPNAVTSSAWALKRAACTCC